MILSVIGHLTTGQPVDDSFPLGAHICFGDQMLIRTRWQGKFNSGKGITAKAQAGNHGPAPKNHIRGFVFHGCLPCPGTTYGLKK